MSEVLSQVSLKKLFCFPFQGPEWVSRFLVGVALLFAGFVIPIVPGIFVGGYVTRVMRQTVDGQAPRLPAWDDWGRMARDGLRVGVISLVYFFPAILVLVGGMALYLFGTLYLPFSMQTSADPESAMASLGVAMMGSMGGMFLAMTLGNLLVILAAAVLPMALGHFVAHDKLGAAFRVGRWWRIMWADKLGYFVCWVVAMGLMGIFYIGIMLVYFTMVLCCLIPILAVPFGLYFSLVAAALFGQTYRENADTLRARTQPIVEEPEI